MTQREIKRELAVVHYALVHHMEAATMNLGFDERGPWRTKTRWVPLAETLTPW
jgi:hypothetical protein